MLSGAGLRMLPLSEFLRDEAEAALDRPDRAKVQACGKRIQPAHRGDCFARRLVAETDLIDRGDAVIGGTRWTTKPAISTPSSAGASGGP